MCIRVYVYVFASHCVCQLLILYKHTHACSLTHTLTHTDDDGKRGTSKRWVEERQRERERKKITLYIGAQDDCYAVCSIYDCRGQMHSRISFRSDDDNVDVPSSGNSTQLRRYGFSSISIIYYSYCSLFSYQYDNYHNSYRFLFAIK
jgi:hypothetical protein